MEAFGYACLDRLVDSKALFRADASIHNFSMAFRDQSKLLIIFIKFHQSVFFVYITSVQVLILI
jgi:hypothetical protein